MKARLGFAAFIVGGLLVALALAFLIGPVASSEPDGLDKVATALVYLNDDWRPEEGGALRYLESEDLDGPGTDPIPATFGAFTAFARSDTSWHGHKPFAGERRVVQLFWLVDEAAAARKDKRHKRTHILKALWPF